MSAVTTTPLVGRSTEGRSDPRALECRQAGDRVPSARRRCDRKAGPMRRLLSVLGALGALCLSACPSEVPSSLKMRLIEVTIGT